MAQAGNGNGRWAWVPAALGAAGIAGSIISYFVQVGTIGATQTTLDRRMTAIESLDIPGYKARTCQLFARVETQVGALSDDINLKAVDEIRFRGIIYPKVFGQPYPTPFYAINPPRDIPNCD